MSAVATLFHLGWDAVSSSMRARRGVARANGRRRFSAVRRIAIDEFAIHKGQTYATLVVDADTKRVLWVARGRDAAALDGPPPWGRRGVRASRPSCWIGDPFVTAVQAHAHARQSCTISSCLQR